MDKQIQKLQKKLAKKEEKLLQVKKQKDTKLDAFQKEMAGKVPPKLKSTLDLAFYKGFQMVFEKGGGMIEKTYSKEKKELEHEINDFAVSRRLIKKGVGKMDAQAMKSHMVNACVTFTEGAGLGLLGIGLPDIPLFIAMLLKGIYETALSYGFSYDNKEERIWMLRLIRTALLEGEEKQACHQKIVKMRKAFLLNAHEDYDFDLEMKQTADALSNACLLLKFVQGVPIVGVIGSVGNFSIYQKTMKYCGIQYKMRYLSGL